MLSSTRLEETGSGSNHADWEENKGSRSALALKIIVATVLERGLWPQPLLRVINFDSVAVFVVLLVGVVFLGEAAAGLCGVWECSF